MWTIKYIISQIFALLGFIALGSSFLIKNKKTILFLNIISGICLAIQYFFLNAYVGMVSTLISVIATTWYYINEKYNYKKTLSLIVITITYIVFGLITFQNWVDILVIMACIGFSYAVWQPNINVYRIIGLCVSLFWLSYDIFYFTLIQMISDILMFIIKLIGIIKIKFEKKHLEEKDKT